MRLVSFTPSLSEPTVAPRRSPLDAVRVRRAEQGDAKAVESLMAPHIAAGTLHHRDFDATAFLVAEADQEVVGCVALSPLGEHAVELGSLVAARSGLGVGRLLVEAAVASASERGARWILAISGSGSFFERCEFAAVDTLPGSIRDLALAEALAIRSGVCGGCPLSRTCEREVFVRPVARPLVLGD